MNLVAPGAVAETTAAAVTPDGSLSDVQSIYVVLGALVLCLLAVIAVGSWRR